MIEPPYYSLRDDLPNQNILWSWILSVHSDILQHRNGTKSCLFETVLHVFE